MTDTAPAPPGASLRKDSAPPFRRILIANRGEIAVRIIRTCRDLGVEVVAVYSDADAAALHVQLADVAVRLGPAPAAESYLRADAIVDAALATGAEAIHPGYGFLSERAAFARAVLDAGIAFIGPRPEAIDGLGDKLAARRQAQAVGVPVVPGTFEPTPVDRPDEVEAILATARDIGFPLLVKASAGGGGRGMRRVTRAEDLPAALAAGSAEAFAAFGDGAVYLEREVRPARHVEVQLLGDSAGDVVALGERDCSIQRRHQKLLEESPAPGLTPDERRALHDLAVRAARAAGLHNAATAEFLFDPERRPWFLEVNARLQVEHGVTELVTGLDLVAEQLWIAAGHPLSDEVRAAAARAAEPTHHAIEARISAEDPGREFAPAPGRIGRWSVPVGEGLRVDTAIRPGERVPPDYDPMIAKVMAVGPDRITTLDRLRDGLEAFEVSGIQTTLAFDRVLLGDPDFRADDGSHLSIDWVAERWDPTPSRDAAARRAARIAAATAGERLSVRKDSDATTPWRTAGRAAAIDRWPRR